MLLAVEDIGLGHILIAAPAQHGLHAVLDILNGDELVVDLALEVRRDHHRQKIDGAVIVVGRGGVKGLFHGRGDLADLEIHHTPVTFYDSVHSLIPLYLS